MLRFEMGIGYIYESSLSMVYTYNTHETLKHLEFAIILIRFPTHVLICSNVMYSNIVQLTLIRRMILMNHDIKFF